MAHSQGTNKQTKNLMETVPEEVQTLDLLDKDFKSGVLKINK